MCSSVYLLLSFPLLTQTAIAAKFLCHIYSYPAPENLSSSLPHGTNPNLNMLLDYVNATAPATGYGSISVRNLYPQLHPPSYALALCRGDVNVTTCQDCVAKASFEIRRAVPSNPNRGIIWFDDCLLKYSDADFFGKVDNGNRYSIWEDAGDVSDILLEFNEKGGDFLSQLSEEASVAPKMYAAGELELEGGMKMHGMVQCTRDLSSGDCKKCLDGLICELGCRFDGTRRARLFGGSCFIDYQIIHPAFAGARAIA